MNCPYCGKEMESGHITAGGYRIVWTPKSRRLSAIPGTDDEIIQSFSLLGEMDNDAHLCRACRKVVVDY